MLARGIFGAPAAALEDPPPQKKQQQTNRRHGIGKVGQDAKRVRERERKPPLVKAHYRE